MNDRAFTDDTKWIICMWDIRGESPLETAKLLKRSLNQVMGIIADCKSDGFYEKVRDHIDYFDRVNTRRALAGFAAALCGQRGGREYER